MVCDLWTGIPQLPPALPPMQARVLVDPHGSCYLKQGVVLSRAIFPSLTCNAPPQPGACSNAWR